MKKELKRILFLCTVLSGVIVFSTYTVVSLAQEVQSGSVLADTSAVVAVPEDTVPAVDEDTPLIYPLNKTEAVTYEDLQYQSPADLQNPSNVRSEVEYDPYSGLYLFRTKVGEMEIVTPFVMDEEEYRDYSLQRSMNAYWAEKNKANKDDSKDKFSFSNIQVGIGKTGDKIFGPGGVQLKTNGSVDLTFGFKISKRDNPTISIRNRKNTIFDFDTKIQLGVEAKVGDRVNFNMNYNTEATFDFDQKLIKLNYEGKEDDIIKRVEAGNVSLPLNGSLITGASALFGIRTDLQFGKLKVSAIATQQESERKTISSQGAQTTEFSIQASDYDENRHYFLSTFFYDNYDQWAKTMPNPESGIVINDIQVWITNRSSYSKMEESRNILAFTDLGEFPGSRPFNGADPLYSELVRETSLRDHQLSPSSLNNFSYRPMENSIDFEVMNNARLLQPTEYTVNRQLGYISLRMALNPDDALAVAYRYTKDGKTYQVGEFSADATEATNNLFVKMLKSTSVSPGNKRLWNLYMKNIYSLGSFNIQPDKFKLDISYKTQNDTASAYFPYIQRLSKTTLVRVLGLDRLNKRGQAVPDGTFDYLEGYTVFSNNGRIVFPSTRPFDTGLINGYKTDAARPFTFPELYDTTLVIAKQFAEKDRFMLSGEYRSSAGGADISLGASNVDPSSVTVRAGGRELTRDVGFIVNSAMGTVTILDPVALESNAPIEVSLESQSLFSMQRKSLVGTNMEYAFSDKFAIGGTFLHLSEKPLTQKVNFGNEPISNTIWGLNGSYKTDWQWLTTVVDKIPLIDATAPSSVAFSGEFAQMIPGHPSVINQGQQGVAYIDDFEGTRSAISIISPVSWALASTPEITGGTKQLIVKNDPFWSRSLPEKDRDANLSNIGYGLNRSLLAWFAIDPIFTRRDRNTPNHIMNDTEQLSNHFVRMVSEREIFRNRQIPPDRTSSMTTLSLSYYPKERGPYNLDVGRMGSDGYLMNPEDRWAGIMRRIENSDFERSNVEYLEFWLMDPFVYDTMNLSSGKLVFNLGDVSEDVLKDGLISFEGGLPNSDNAADVDITVWGRVPKIQSANVAPTGDISRVDVGLDGLSTDNELLFNLSYGIYKQAIDQLIDPVTRQRYESQIVSPLSDPAGDNFYHFQYADYDDRRTSILERYKYFNGLEGNSTPTSGSAASYSLNTEDLNGDRTLNQNERYYEYVVNIDKNLLEDSTRWESNFIASRVRSTVQLANKKDEEITWYQFKIPIRTPKKRTQGSISDFRSIRFIRMYMTEFTDETHLRFGTMEFVRTEWKTYKRDDLVELPTVRGTGKIDISSVNIENDGRAKIPVNYVLPPGIDRTITPDLYSLQENEQSMLLRVDSLEPGDARAVYKQTNVDMRRYDRFKMFVHAERMLDRKEVEDGKLWVFVRLGSDFTQNYYEYQIPLAITPDGSYNNGSREVWPEQNEFDFPFSVLTDFKLKRDRDKAAGLASFTKRYQGVHGQNLMYIMGNPSIGEVTCMMIGVMNQDGTTSHSAEIWINEMRMSGFSEKGGWGAVGDLGIVFSDLGAVNIGGRYETVGFGQIEQSVEERNLDDYMERNASASIQLGKFFPEKARVNMPFTYSYSKRIYAPEYDPMNTDIKMQQTLDNQISDKERKEIEKRSLDQAEFQSFALSNVRIGITSKTPMPYDPANFSVSWRYTEEYKTYPEAEYEKMERTEWMFNYVYSLNPKPVEPFRKMKQTPFNKLIRDFNFYYLPKQLAFSTSMNNYYKELQLRDFSMPAGDRIERSDEFPFLTWDKDWTWDRTSDIKYDLTKSLRFSFNSSVNSLVSEVIRVDSGYLDVPRNGQYLIDIEQRDWYDKWKDTVNYSWLGKGLFGNFAGFGSVPLRYQQRFNAAYTVPVNKLPYLDWVTSNAQYTADYVWDKGVELTMGDPLSSSGNLMSGARMWTFDSRLNFETLYNRSAYLKAVNQKYSSRSTPSKKEPEKPKTYERKNIRLRKNTPFRVSHRLNTNKLTVTLMDKDSNVVSVKHSVVDLNTINLESTEDISDLSISIKTIVKERTAFDNVLEIAARGMMMIRNVNANFRYGDALSLQGYRPGSGWFGQDENRAELTPGADFIFGFFKNDDFIEKSLDKSWLDTTIANVISPATRTRVRDFQIRSLVEPMPGLKIDLNGTWMRNSVDENYSFFNQDTKHVYSRTTIAIGTAFVSPDSHSLFAEFRNNRQRLAAQLRQENGNAAGTDNINSPEVLIPSFYAAYTGIDKDRRNIMPGILSLLPNWRITYDGLSRLEFIKQHFKSVTLTHAYRSTYNLSVAENALGYYVGTSLYNPDAGATYNTSSSGSQYGGSRAQMSGNDGVSINEAFYPLIGVEASMKNSLMAKAEYRTTRSFILGIQGNQLVETYSDEYVIGIGYRIDDFGMIVRLNDNKQKKVKNDLNIRADLSFKTSDAFVYFIEENTFSPSTGLDGYTIKVSADYVFSESFNIRLFYDWTRNVPKVSTSYPTTNINFGLGLRFLLVR